MRMYDIIAKKRDNLKLTKEELAFFINGYDEGQIPDYQASALLMAIYLNGLDDEETSILTKLMADSGEKLDLSALGKFTVDKHSTGGVGDKTTLIVAPIAAAAGCTVAKMSGRGLGFTGGTVDKLESIKGYNSSLNPEEFENQVKNIGIAVTGQSGKLTPADKKLYALRDVTATVESIPLIASSIMSKKIAAGAKSIVLDVKFGSGAFMKTPKSACLLAKKMIEIGKKNGRNTAAVISDMDSPLGNNIGNFLEVEEAVKILKCEEKGELREVCLTLSAEMIALSKKIPFDKALDTATRILDEKKAYAKFLEWISAQGADLSFIENSDFKKAEFSLEVKSEKSGFVYKTDTALIGSAAGALGAGRIAKEDKIDFLAGIIINKKKGDFVKASDVLCTLYSGDKDKLDEAKALILKAFEFSDKMPEKTPHIYKIIE